MSEQLPASVELVEVGPRDGLQNERTVLPLATRVEFIERAIAAGLTRVEVASFVNPKKVPQMADAEALLAALPRRDGVRRIGLVLNRRGCERALAAGVDEIGMVVAATDTFGLKNQGANRAEAIAAWLEIAPLAAAARVPAQVTVSTAFGCPFEGEVDPGQVVEVVRRLAPGRPYEVALADTIGVAVPGQVTALFRQVRAALPELRFRGHFHNTRNTGLANAYAAVTAGVTTLDASLGGIGGCPFAPKATGNIPTEDLVYMLERMGIDTGVDLEALIATGRWLEAQLGRPVPGMLIKAGAFPRPAA